jgi:hypothetical protein
MNQLPLKELYLNLTENPTLNNNVSNISRKFILEGILKVKFDLLG